MLYTDFKKAFVRVNIRILVNKLYQFGIRGRLLAWFYSYLSNRSTKVVFNGHWSDAFCPQSGVPQGSILGPLLFLLFINDLPIRLKSENTLFADDLKIYSKINNTDDCIRLQEDIDRLSSWCALNDLELNISKCFAMNFSYKRYRTELSYKIGHNTLEEVTYIKDLGVWFDSKL